MSFALPLFIMAIGGIYSERSGITNLALEGLQGMGAFTGALVAYCLIRSMGGTSQVPYYMAMLFAMIGGAVYSMLHAAHMKIYQITHIAGIDHSEIVKREHGGVRDHHHICQ